jgi:hypothetical protein
MKKSLLRQEDFDQRSEFIGKRQRKSEQPGNFISLDLRRLLRYFQA